MSRMQRVTLAVLVLLCGLVVGDVLGQGGTGMCVTGCDHWTGEWIPDPGGDWCRVMNPAQCINNKKSDASLGQSCIPADGNVTYEHCTANSCTNVCNAATCGVAAHPCEQEGMGGHMGCSFITTATRYECFDAGSGT